jgi:hypothetical protein
MSEQDDFAEELRGDDGEPMNDKKGSLGQAVVVAVIGGLITVGIGRITDSSDERALATLTERVSNLSIQVQKLSEQPYATRADLTGIENRLSGLDARVRDVERAQLQRGQR